MRKSRVAHGIAPLADSKTINTGLVVVVVVVIVVVVVVVVVVVGR